MGVCCLGLGLTQAWLWLVFLSGPLLSGLPDAWGPAPRLALLFLAFHALTFAVLAAIPRRPGSSGGARRPWGIKAPVKARTAALAMTVGTAVLALPPSLVSIVTLPGRVGVAAAVVAAAGGAVQVVLWGEFYSTLDGNRRILYYAGSIVLGTIALFIGGAFPHPFSLLIASALPFASAGCLGHVMQDAVVAGDLDFEPDRSRVNRAFPPVRPALAVLVVLVYLVGGLMHRTIYIEGAPFGNAYWITNVLYAVAAGAAGAAFHRRVGLDLRHIGRPALSALGLGFLLFPACQVRVPALPYSLFQLGFAMLDMYTWVAFAGIAARHESAVRAMAAGLALLTGSMFLGEILYPLLTSAGTGVTRHVEMLSVAGAATMFVATVLILDREASGATSEGVLPASPGAPPVQESGVDPGEAGEDCTEPGRTCASTDAFLDQYRLTPREREIALLLLDGRDNPSLRTLLKISNNTLKTHLHSIYQKMAMSGRREMLAEYYKFALMDGHAAAGGHGGPAAGQ
ncbi:MAG: helix-turn-helix transcriptional regulator [Bacillota bacterium]